MSYVIYTDTSADLPADIIAQYGIKVIPLSYSVDGSEHRTASDGSDNLADFYAMMREKRHTVGTSMAGGESYADEFEELLGSGTDIIYLAFSSGLSGTCASFADVAVRLSAKYPERKLFIVDTLSASLGEGLIVLAAARMKAAGAEIEEVRDWVVGNRLKVCHWFTVDDLDYLRRGGRIPAAVAIIGSVLQIKPVLHMDDNGHLVAVGRAKGRAGSLEKLVDKIGELGTEPEKQTILISHGDCAADAEVVVDMIKSRYSPAEIIINVIDATIGCHSGPGTVAVFFLGRRR